MVLGCEERLDVLKLTTPVLQPNRRLRGVGPGHVLGQPLPKQSGNRADHWSDRSDGVLGCRLPGQLSLTPRG